VHQDLTRCTSASTATGNAVGQLFCRLVQKRLINQEEEEEEEVKRFSRDVNSACMHACCKQKARKW
jgi:hypothetical protein